MRHLARRLLRLYRVQMGLVQQAHPRDQLAELVKAEVLLAAYFNLVAVKTTTPPPVIKRHLTIEAYVASVGSCGTKLRFRNAEDLRQLYTLLEIPDTCHLGPQAGTIRGEHLYLFFIQRIALAQRVAELIEDFGYTKTKWSFAFRWMAKFIYGRHKQRLSAANLVKWACHFPAFAASMRLVANGTQYKPHFGPAFNVCAIPDCKNTATPVPGGGPAGRGPGAPRNPDIQEVVYNGWLHKHGYKHQTLEFVNGLTGWVWGPESMRQNDLFCQAHSGLNKAIKDAQAHLPGQHLVGYGDSIYMLDTHVKRRHNDPAGAPTKLRHDAEDKAMSSVRETCEHHYGELDSLFPYGNAKELKLKNEQHCIREISFCRFFLRNCYVCLYHGKTSERFGHPPPSLPVYFAMWP